MGRSYLEPVIDASLGDTEQSSEYNPAYHGRGVDVDFHVLELHPVDDTSRTSRLYSLGALSMLVSERTKRRNGAQMVSDGTICHGD